MSRRAALNAFGSCGNVRACQPTMEYMSWSSGAASRCSFTQFNRAPRRFPSYSRQCEYFTAVLILPTYMRCACRLNARKHHSRTRAGLLRSRVGRDSAGPEAPCAAFAATSRTT